MSHSCETESVHPRHVAGTHETAIRARLRARTTSPEGEGVWNQDQQDARHLAAVLDIERDQSESLWIAFRDEQWAKVRALADVKRLTAELAAHELAAQMADAQFREILAAATSAVANDNARR